MTIKPEKIRLTKAFPLNIKHALYGYDGNAKETFGPTLQLQVTISGTPLNQSGHPKDGMVIDFKELQQLIQNHIIAPYHRAIILHEKTHSGVVNHLENIHQKVIQVSFQPTCENLLLHFTMILKEKLTTHPNLDLIRMRLYETITAYVEWNAQ